ncbi:unnamed protein product [Caenorhabditis auriculariae]|uniref:Uncharacterized protein n=1 Tax=Caenorhabditis auriculariae TaxID=2777116 RepID=A0A8S1H1H8_9PELO|nr:unnamed protein product [Caenorhabditis auriculariae]
MNRIFLALLALSVINAQKDIYSLLSQKSLRPPTENASTALEVKLGMYLESLGNFRSTEMSFDVDLYVYMSWKDIRLSHNFSDYVLVNDDETRQKIWLPDLYFANARQAHFQEVTVPNFNLFVAPDGTIAMKRRTRTFEKKDSSDAYIAKKMNVTWFAENPIRYNPDIGLPEFQIEHVTKGYCNGTYRYALTAETYKLDDFSCLTGNLFLSRSIGYNLVQSYIPTGLIVMISWVSFWIDRRAVPARVTLSFTTLVSLTTLGNGLRFGLPQVSYAKAIDLWYGVCMLFVFCALLEFATINSYMRKAEKFEAMAKKVQASVFSGKVNSSDTSNDNWHCCGNEKGKSKKYSERDSIQEASSEKIKFIDHDFEMKVREGPVTPMSIYDNSSCPKRNKVELDDSSAFSDDETHFGGKKVSQTYNTKSISPTASTQDEGISATSYQQTSQMHSRYALKIDKTCRYLFPLSFLLWNSFYWWYYLVFQKVVIEP